MEYAHLTTTLKTRSQRRFYSRLLMFITLVFFVVLLVANVKLQLATAILVMCSLILAVVASATMWISSSNYYDSLVEPAVCELIISDDASKYGYTGAQLVVIRDLYNAQGRRLLASQHISIRDSRLA